MITKVRNVPLSTTAIMLPTAVVILSNVISSTTELFSSPTYCTAISETP